MRKGLKPVFENPHHRTNLWLLLNIKSPWLNSKQYYTVCNFKLKTHQAAAYCLVYSLWFCTHLVAGCECECECLLAVRCCIRRGAHSSSLRALAELCSLSSDELDCSPPDSPAESPPPGAPFFVYQRYLSLTTLGCFQLKRLLRQRRDFHTETFGRKPTRK